MVSRSFRTQSCPSNTYKGIDSHLRDNLREEYSNAANFSDGEIFRHIRHYQKSGGILQERKWWARLTRDKSKDLKRILDVHSLRDAFDQLLEVTGLWPAFHIGTMRRYLLLRCHEVSWICDVHILPLTRSKELTNYLHLVHKVWSGIAGDDLTMMRLIDGATVKLLESRAPGNSDEDARLVQEQMHKRSIFGAILDLPLRSRLLTNLLALDKLIPSLHTFCEDTKYLEPCANAMKRLLEPGLKGTVQGTMRAIFNQPLQQDEDGLFKQNYRQLWAFAHRHFPELVNVAPRKEPDRDKPTIKEPNPITWFLFAQLAVELGFRSDSIRRLKSKKELENSLRHFLLPVTEHLLDQQLVGRLVRQLRHSITTKSDAAPNNEKPSLVDNESDLDLRHRCGRPHEVSQREARKSMYIRWIYDASLAKGRYVTHHYVHRAIFRAFFGDDSRPAATAVLGSGLQHAEGAQEPLPTNLNPTMMPTATAAARPDEEMPDLERQPSTDALGGSHVSGDDDSDDTMSSLDSLDTPHRLGNDTALQLPWEGWSQERRENEKESPTLRVDQSTPPADASDFQMGEQGAGESLETPATSIRTSTALVPFEPRPTSPIWVPMTMDRQIYEGNAPLLSGHESSCSEAVSAAITRSSPIGTTLAMPENHEPSVVSRNTAPSPLMQIEGAETEEAQIQRLSNSKRSQQIQHVATTEEGEQETAAADQIRPSSSALAVLESPREDSRAEEYVRAPHPLIFRESLQNTRAPKRHLMAEAGQTAKEDVEPIGVQAPGSPDRRKFRRGHHRRVPVLSDETNYQRTYTGVQAPGSPDRRKFRRDLLHRRIPVPRDEMNNQRTYNFETGPPLAEAGQVAEGEGIPTGAKAPKKGRKSRRNFDRWPRKGVGPYLGHQVEEEEEEL